MEEKYGQHLVASHQFALERFIKKDMDDKAVYGLRDHDSYTSTTNRNGRWFAIDNRVEKHYVKLDLPPVDRTEPSIGDRDVAKYREHIKHHDPYKLSVNEYIKHGLQPLETQPDKWNKKIPRKAMKDDLRRKGASRAMVGHFEQVYENTLRSVSWKADCATDGINKRQAEPQAPGYPQVLQNPRSPYLPSRLALMRRRFCVSLRLSVKPERPPTYPALIAATSWW